VVASAAPAPRYQWRRNGISLQGATLSTLSISRVADVNAGTYDVVVSNSGGTVTSASVALTVRNPGAFPLIQVQPSAPPKGVEEGDSVNFRIEALDPNGSALTLQWNFNGVPIPGAVSGEWTISSVEKRHAGTYTVTVTAANGRSTTSTAAVLVVRDKGDTPDPEDPEDPDNPGGPQPPETPETPETEKPAIVAFRAVPQVVLAPKSPLALLLDRIRGEHQADHSIAAGSEVRLEVEAQNGGTSPTYIWQRNGVPVPAAPSLPVYSVSDIANGDVWTVVVSNSIGSVASPPLVFEVIQPPEILRPLVAPVGLPGVLRVEATGEPQLFYQWFKDGVPISGAILSTYEVRTAGRYKVIVSNRGGAVSSEIEVR
jgi:hypothetical protein